MTSVGRNYEVTAQDQQRINSFSRLVTQKVELVERHKKLKEELEKLQDAMLELELLDEDSYVHRRVGESYVLVKQEEAVSFLQSKENSLNEQLKELEDNLESIKKEMEELKKVLYGKFGNAINLEEEEEE
eukprot:ctg_15.g30